MTDPSPDLRAEPEAAPSPEVAAEAELLVQEERVGQSPQGIATNTALRALSRAARSFLLYEPHNEAIKVFLTDYRLAIQTALGIGPLHLEVRPFELVMEGEIVYLERERDRSLAFRMFRDGVRRLDISTEASWDELLKLLEILSIRYTGVRQYEDDIVTLLWKAGFKGIDVVAVEGFVPDEEEEGERQVAASPKSRAANAEHGAQADVPADFDLPLPELDAPQAYAWAAIPEAALASRRDEVRSLALPALCVQLLREMFDLVADLTDPTSIEDVANLVEEVRGFLLSEGQLGSLLQVVEILATQHETAPEWVGRELLRFVDTYALGRILHSTARSHNEAPPELEELLRRIPGDHLSVLVEVLHVERHVAARQIIRALLQRYLTGREEWLTQKVATLEGAVAADLLSAVHAARPALAAKMSVGVADRSEREIQVVILSILKDIPKGALDVDQLFEMLRTPDLEVRTQLYANLLATPRPGLFDRLILRLEGQTRELEDEEAAEIGRTLARLDPERGAEVLQPWVRPRGLWKQLSEAVKGARTRHQQYAGVAGLALLAGDKVEADIQWLAGRAGAQLHAFCMRTLVQRRHRMMGGAADV